MATQTAPSIEQLSEHVTREWLNDRRIVIFRNTGSARTEIDFAVTVVHDTIQTWPRDQVYLSIIDGSHHAAILTPYARQKLEEIAKLFPEVKGRTAILIDRSPTGHIIRLFARMQFAKGSRVKRVFFTREEALAWLHELL